MVHGWPDGHTYKHLKRAVLLKLVEEREDVVEKLQRHLDKSSFTYEEAVEEIRSRNNLEEIPKYLGDFVLAAISLTIGLPIYVVKPVVERTVDQNQRPVVRYNAQVEYLFNRDKGRATGAERIVMCFNGIDYYAPAVPRQIVKISRGLSTATQQIGDAIKNLESVLEEIPTSSARDAISKALSFMGASRSYVEGTKLATGTTVRTNLPVETPIPQPVSAATSTKMAHKRAAAALNLEPPAKKQRESEESFKTRKKEYRSAVTLAAKRSTKLGENQCVCGKEFDTNELLKAHMQNTHIDKKSWECPICNKNVGSKSHLWTHVRHHMGKYYHYCDVQYDDEDDLDSKGNPKVKTCDVMSDEESYIGYHREKAHEVGKAPIRCPHCDAPQMSKRRLDDHVQVCEQGPTGPSEPTHFCDIGDCDYSCRGTQTLRNHKKVEHHKEVGLPAPQRWSCHKCGKQFTTANGAKLHKCKKAKKPKKPSATVSKRKYFISIIPTINCI